jgi:DNA-binding GntR family transcriptional regulator
MGEAVDKAYRTIREGIVSGRLAQGSHIKAQVLAAASGLSRTPVREALRRLHSEGLIHFIPNRGAYVASWSQEDVEQYFDLCVLLEGFAAELAAKRVTEAEIEDLRRMVEEMNALMAPASPDVPAVKEANDRFHRKIMAICGNVRLERFLSSLIEADLVFSTFQHYSLDELRRAAMQHEELVAAIAARDQVWARSVMGTHLLSARHTMLRALREDQSRS